jgi:hypothetical protein
MKKFNVVQRNLGSIINLLEIVENHQLKTAKA